MATILDFRALARERGRAGPCSVGTGGAQILLFTGVRYERTPGDQDPSRLPRHKSKPTAKSSRRRDRLEIVE